MPPQSYSPEALNILRTKFAAAKQYPLDEYERIAESTGESVDRVRSWFGNQRQAQKAKAKTSYKEGQARPKPAFGVGGLPLPAHGACNRKRQHHLQSAEARFGSRPKQQRRAHQEWLLADGSLDLELMQKCAEDLCIELQDSGDLTEGTAPSIGTIHDVWQALWKRMNAAEPMGYPGGFVKLMADIGRSTSQLSRRELGKAGYLNVVGKAIGATELAAQIQSFRSKYEHLDPELGACFPRMSHTKCSLGKQDRGLYQAVRIFCQDAGLTVEEFAKVIQVSCCFCLGSRQFSHQLQQVQYRKVSAQVVCYFL